MTLPFSAACPFRSRNIEQESETKRMDKLKIGIVGLNRGGRHVYVAQFNRYVIVNAVCDLDGDKARQIADEYHIPGVYADYAQMLAEADIDAVIIATPIGLHVEHACMALSAGKHVLSEVTVATTMEDLEKLKAAVQASGKVYMMAENYNYYRPLTIIENMIRAGLLGEIYYAEGDYLKTFETYPNYPHIGGWREPTYFGRRGHPYITHSLGPIAHIMGERMSDVVCMGAGQLSNDIRPDGWVADHTCVLMMHTEKNHLVRLRNSFVSPRPDMFLYYMFQGTKGCFKTAEYEGDFHKVHIQGLHKPNEWHNIEEFAGFLPEGWKRLDDLKYNDLTGYDSGAPMMQEAFALSCLNDTQPPITLLDAMNWTAAGLLSAESVVNGAKRIEVPTYRDVE